MKKLYYIVIVLILLLSCKQEAGDDLSGSGEVRGTLVLKDTLRGAGSEIVLKNHSILLKRQAELGTANYLQRVQSDEQGAFLVTNLAYNGYFLYAEREVNGVLFSSTLPIRPDSVTTVKMILYPDTSKNHLLRVTTVDSLRGPLYKAQVCVFRSSIAARTNACDGAFFTGMTDEFGRFVVAQLDTGWYFVNAQLTIGALNVKGRDSLRVTGNRNVRSLTVVLK